jgi:hypothetical protein
MIAISRMIGGRDGNGSLKINPKQPFARRWCAKHWSAM